MTQMGQTVDEEIEMRHYRRETNGCLKILVIYWKGCQLTETLVAPHSYI